MTKYRVGLIGLGNIASTIDDGYRHGHPAIMLPYAHAAGYRVCGVVGEQPPPVHQFMKGRDLKIERRRSS